MKIIARLTTILLLAVTLYCHGQSAGPDQTVCFNAVATMAATGTGTWMTFPGNPGTASINIPSSPTTTISGFSQSGVYAFFWTNGSTQDTAYVTVFPSLGLTGTVTNVSCHGGSGGAVCVSASGSAPFSYIWSTGQIGGCVTGLVAGNYCVTVADANGCTAQYCNIVTQPSSAFTVAETHTDVLCHGAATGTITLTQVGGTTPYNQPVWSDMTIGTTRINMPAGTYTYLDSDANGCPATGSITISEPAVGFTISETHVNAYCNGDSTGSITLTLSGGTTAYNTPIWADGPTGLFRTNLAAGSYSVSVLDANGCLASNTIVISQSSQLSVSETHIDVQCHGLATGQVVLSASGGTAPYTYLWMDNDITLMRFGLTAGLYSYTVTDQNLCAVTGSVTIAEPGGTAVTLTDSVHNADCNNANGSICVTATGGAGSYTYTWTPGGITVPCASGLPAGLYSVTVMDSSGCGAVLADSIRHDPSVVMSIADTLISCYGMNNGSICISASGGSGSYTYSWTTGSTTPCISGLSPGTYFVVVADTSGCTAMDSVQMTQPMPLSITDNVQNTSCWGTPDGAICLNVTGGVSWYTYTWGNFPDSAGSCTSGLSPGTYSVTVLDVNGCTATHSASVMWTTMITVTDTVINATCGRSDGSIHAVATGGAQPYTYVWNTTPPNTTDLATGLTAGNYNLTVVDAGGCIGYLFDSVTTDHNCMWPGDADNNLLVDNNDLLPIGLGYDTTGPARAAVSIVWQAESSADWPQAFNSYTPAVNYKYADCNGDGVINSNDTLAISQNFGLTHTKRNGPAPWRTGLSAIYPVISKDTITNGDTLLISINMGDVSLAATNVYGVAFDINYDAAVVDTAQTSMAFDNSWFGNANDKISIAKDLKSQGVIKVGMTRIDHTTRTGQGQIAHMRAIVTTDNIDGKNLSYYGFRCSISNVKAIDAQAQPIDFNEGVDSNEVAYTPLGIESTDDLNPQISLYPNPAASVVTISSARTPITAVTLTNMLGENVSAHSYTDRKKEQIIDLQGLSSGIYYVAIQTQAGTTTRKVTVNH